MIDLDELIEEARECHQARGWSKDPLVNKLENLANRLANALEAAEAERDAALARIVEIEATVDAQDRQIEARSGETAAERMFKEELLKAKARIAELEMTVTSASFEFHEQFERAEQAEAELRDLLRVDIPSLKAERDAALARIVEIEATVDAQDRQIEARSGETAAERMFKEELLKAKARIAELEAELEVAMRPHSECERSGAEAGERIVDLEGDLARAEARIAEAANLHRKHKHWNSDREYVFVCDECTRINRYGIAQWPCPTAVVLGLNEGENE